MSEYNLFAGVNASYEFPPEVRAALIDSLNIRDVGAPMTTAQRNALNSASLDPGYYIFNTQKQCFQIWRSDFEQWHDSLASPGSRMWWPGSTLPAGWRRQDGSSLSRSTYSALYSVIGTTYGGSNTPEHFKLPNTAGKTMVDAMEDPSYALGFVGGSPRASLSVNQLPKHTPSGTVGDKEIKHTHTGGTSPSGNHTHGYWWITTGEFRATGSGPADNGVYRAARTYTSSGEGGDHSHSVSTVEHAQTHNHSFTGTQIGNDESHENMMPYMAGYFIIKY